MRTTAAEIPSSDVPDMSPTSTRALSSGLSIFDQSPDHATHALEALHGIVLRQTELLHNDSSLHVAAGGGEQFLRLVTRDRADLHQNTLAPILELEVRRLEIDHQVPV